MIGRISNILVLDGVDDVCSQILKKNGIQVTVNPKMPKEELLKEIKNYDAVIVRSATKITAEVLAATSRLRLVGRPGTGVDNVDIGEATRRGVIVMNTPGGNTLSAAEHTCAMICSLARSIPQACASLKAGAWDRKKYMGNELYGKTLAIVGLGRIGREVSKRMQSFGMTTIGYDPFVGKEAAAEWGIESLSLEEIWPRADYITLHTPLLPHTKHMINDGVFSRCRSGVRIINVARGGIVDEAALLTALNDGRCGGAALDVFVEEPPKDLSVCQHPKVICTPHLGANTFEAQKRVAEEIADQIGDFNEGRPLVGVVNAPSLTNALKKECKPWIMLSQALGCLTSSLLADDIRKYSIQMDLFGSSSGMGDFLPSSFLVGLLKSKYKNINLVNASMIAKESGANVMSNSINSNAMPLGLTSGIRIHVNDQTKAVKHSLIGSSVGDKPILFSLDGCTWESGLTLGRNMLFFRASSSACRLADIATNLSTSSLTSLLSSSCATGCSDVFHVARTEDLVATTPNIPDLHCIAQVSF